MPPQLHVDPDRLRRHAVTAAALADDLGAALAEQPDDADADRLHTATRRAVQELTELSAVLAAVSRAAADADRAAAVRLTGL